MPRGPRSRRQRPKVLLPTVSITLASVSLSCVKSSEVKSITRLVPEPCTRVELLSDADRRHDHDDAREDLRRRRRADRSPVAP